MVLPAGADLCSGHAKHAVTPVAAEYLPASQLVQTVEGDDAEYLPAIQLVHTVKAAAPEYVPAVQLLHTVAAGS